MNWNFEVGEWQVRLPVTDQDGDALFRLMSSAEALAHWPRSPMVASVQALDELRRMNMRFQAHQAAFWLVHKANDDSFSALLTLEDINWVQLQGRINWALDESFSLDALRLCLTGVMNFVFDELGLYRLDMRIADGSDGVAEALQTLGFQHEGYLPAQLEFDDAFVDLQVWSFLATDRADSLPSNRLSELFAQL